MKKRILTVLLAVCLVFALGTVSALADDPVSTEDNVYTTLPAADSDGVIKLDKDVVLQTSAVIEGSIVLDLNGHSITASDNAVIYPGESGKDGRDVYSTLIMGANAYGITEVDGGGLQHIIKQLGSAGSADPLNQRATAGWKAIRAVERLIEPYMIRIETTSTFDGLDQQ